MAAELQDTFCVQNRTVLTGSTLTAVQLKKSAFPQLVKFSPRCMEPEAPPPSWLSPETDTSSPHPRPCLIRVHRQSKWKFWRGIRAMTDKSLTFKTPSTNCGQHNMHTCLGKANRETQAATCVSVCPSTKIMTSVEMKQAVFWENLLLTLCVCPADTHNVIGTIGTVCQGINWYYGIHRLISMVTKTNRGNLSRFSRILFTSKCV